MPDRDDFLRELHHRVKNNFQIIASLMNLQKRMLAPERRSDLRFVEEHVQSMAVAYRIVSTGSELVQVPIEDLVRETADNLRQIAGVRAERLQLDLSQDGAVIELNQGIVLGLYLAVVLPPQLDKVGRQGGALVIRTAVTDNDLTISIAGVPVILSAMDFMRRRLIDAYVRQLRAEVANDEDAGGELRLRFGLEPARAVLSRRGGSS
jgi:hypothetical protein